MFVQNLNSEQQAVLLALAEQVMDSDGTRHKTQEAVLETLKLQVNEGVTAGTVDIMQIATLFSDYESKAALMLELIGVAYANGEFHDKERNIISAYSKLLDMNELAVNDMVEWVKGQMFMMEFAKRILAGVNTERTVGQGFGHELDNKVKFKVLTKETTENSTSTPMCAIYLVDNDVSLSQS